MPFLIPRIEHLFVLLHDFYVRFALLLTRLALFVFFFLVEIADDLPESLVLGRLIRSLILTSHEVLLHVQSSQFLLIDQLFVLLPFFHLDIPILHSPHLKHFPLLL